MPFDPYTAHCLRLVVSGHPLIVFDTETTGLPIPGQPEPEVWQIGIIRRGGGLPRVAHTRLLNLGHGVPQRGALPPVAAELLARDGRPPAEVLARFATFCGEAVMVGHNADRFDVPVLASAYRRAGLAVPPALSDPERVIDTCRLARALLPAKGTPGAPPSFGLEKLGAYLGLRYDPSALHDAGADVALTEQLLDALVDLAVGRRELPAAA